uniref:Macro domain-containing protein n=1 Tax=Takifugu rubripes TaxID=31033 RepID=A0A674N8S6_TAKRU
MQMSATGRKRPLAEQDWPQWQGCTDIDRQQTVGEFGEGSWRLNYVTGDLFSCPGDEALAHCISEDCHMGAGIALMFRKKFNGVEELKQQKKVTGQCAVLKRHKRYVYYLITKKRFNNKPSYESLRQSLEDMKTHCTLNGVTRLSMPRIGCGLDRLHWDRVLVILEQVFKHSDISVTIYSLPERAKTHRSTGGLKYLLTEKDKLRSQDSFDKKQDTMPPPPGRSLKGSWRLNYFTGDLFSCPGDEALAHCISEDCHMGAGIALMFRKKFNGVEELKQQKKVTGQCAVLKRHKRYVYYLITKKRFNNKPSYESLRQSLEDMKTHCTLNGVTRLSMPRFVSSSNSGISLNVCRPSCIKTAPSSFPTGLVVAWIGCTGTECR